MGGVKGINNKTQKGKRRPQNKRPSTRKQTKKSRVTKGKVQAQTPTLSHCAVKYATAIADPWSPSAEGACIPRHPSRPSMKVRGFTRLTVTIGTEGYGFALLAPCLANNAPCILYSNGEYDGSLSQFVSVASAGVSDATMSGLPFAKSSFEPANVITPAAVSGRIVSMAMSWQYTGTVTAMGGLSYALTLPDHSNINCIGTEKIGNFAETQIIRGDSQRHWVGISSVDENELNYVNPVTGTSVTPTVDILYPYSNGQRFGTSTDDALIGGCPTGVWFSGEPGNTFLVEVVGHYEFVGASAQYALTPTHSDSSGFEIVQAASQRIQGLSQAYPRASRPALMNTALGEIGRELAPVARVAGMGLLRIGTSAIAGAAMGFAKYGAAGMLTGAALGTARGALQLTNG